jgi:hypothetical protein
MTEKEVLDFKLAPRLKIRADGIFGNDRADVLADPRAASGVRHSNRCGELDTQSYPFGCAYASLGRVRLCTTG